MDRVINRNLPFRYLQSSWTRRSPTSPHESDSPLPFSEIYLTRLNVTELGPPWTCVERVVHKPNGYQSIKLLQKSSTTVSILTWCREVQGQDTKKWWDETVTVSCQPRTPGIPESLKENYEDLYRLSSNSSRFVELFTNTGLLDHRQTFFNMYIHLSYV